MHKNICNVDVEERLKEFQMNKLSIKKQLIRNWLDELKPDSQSLY